MLLWSLKPRKIRADTSRKSNKKTTEYTFIVVPLYQSTST